MWWEVMPDSQENFVLTILRNKGRGKDKDNSKPVKSSVRRQEGNQ